MGLTTIIISPSSAFRLQSNLSLSFRLNCLTMLAGTVVLNEVVLVAALDRMRAWIVRPPQKLVE